jgi:hypothetical protein
LYLSAKSSIIVACPYSAAKCIGVRSVDTKHSIFQVYRQFLRIMPSDLFLFIKMTKRILWTFGRTTLPDDG